jgi:hypothetical protein
MEIKDLIAAAEAKLIDAERNLAGCATSLAEHSKSRGGVPNAEVIALSQAQAAVAQAYASLALAKSGIAMLNQAAAA